MRSGRAVWRIKQSADGETHSDPHTTLYRRWHGYQLERSRMVTSAVDSLSIIQEDRRKGHIRWIYIYLHGLLDRIPLLSLPITHTSVISSRKKNAHCSASNA